LDKNITGSATIFQLIVNQSQVLLKKINWLNDSFCYK
jgi:hypothetical protein